MRSHLHRGSPCHLLDEEDVRYSIKRGPIAGTTYGFAGFIKPSDAPRHPRPDGADERDLRAAEEKRARRAERRRQLEESRERGIVCAAGGNWCCDAAVCLCGSER